MDSHLVDIDEAVTVGQLLDCIFVVFERVVTHVSVSIVVVPLRSAWMTSALTYRYHDETGLSEAVSAYAHACERIVDSLNLRTWVDVIHYRIDFCRVKVKWFVHHSVEVGDAVRSLYLEKFREFVSVGEEL